MKYCDQITFVIFTYNEEARIERAVRNFATAGRVLVVDNHSTDRTEEIAVGTGATILKHKNPGWVEDASTVAVVKAAVTTPWIYWGFADELVDKPTLEAVLAAVNSGTCEIVRMTRKNYYYGVFCHGAYASELNRVFRKEAIDFRGNEIHHFGKLTVTESSIKHLDSHYHFVHHFISNNAKSYLRTIDAYTDIESKRPGPKSAVRMVLQMTKTFVANYFIRKGYKAGLPGLFLSFQMIYYEALLNMKSYEAHEGLVARKIEDLNDSTRDGLLSSFR